MTATTPATKPLLRVLSGMRADPPPIWLMRQAGRYLPEYRATRAQAKDFVQLCLTPELATEVTLQPIRRYGFDAAILFSDILMVPHGLGQKLAFLEGEGPKLEPVRDAQALGRLSVGGVAERLAPVMETVRRLSVELPKEVALIGFAGSPWTVACYMVEGGGGDFTRVRRWSVSDPETFGRLIDLLVDATVIYLDAQIEAGAEVIQLFDSWAGILDETGFGRWVIEPTRRIIERLRGRHPGVRIIGFPRAAGALMLGYAATTGIDAIGLDYGVPLGWAADALPANLALQGNLDPVVLVAGGVALEDATRRILVALKGRAHVFNLGHGITPDTPLDHVARLIEIVRERA
jgi:uroporphyrinogen decarboxylase